MGAITLPNFRTTADVTMNTRLKDGGVAIDWAGLTNIKAWLYSDAQKAIAGRCDVSIDAEDPTVLVCTYAASKPQYLGVNRLIVQATYGGRTKTYDKPAFTFVRWTAGQAGEQITMDDPTVDVEIVVEDVSSSIMDTVILAAVAAAELAEAAAEAAEHMVDIHTGPQGPAGKPPYIGENGNWFEWDEDTDQYVDTEVKAHGDTGDTGATPDITIGTVTTGAAGSQASASMGGTPEDPVLNLTIPRGDTGAEGKSAYEVAVEEGFVGTEEEWLASLEGPIGATPDISIGTVTTVEPGTPASASMTGTPEAPVLNLTIPNGAVGATPNFTVGTVTTGAPGSQVVVTITGTPEAPVLNVTIPQGIQGNTGSSVDYPFELVNNLTTNDPTQALSAQQGKVLKDEITITERATLTGTITDGYYIKSNGDLASTTGFKVCVYPVSPGDSLEVYSDFHTGVVARSYAIYSGEPLSSSTVLAIGPAVNSAADSQNVTVPSGGAYIAVQTYTNSQQSVTVIKNDSVKQKLVSFEEEVESKVVAINARITELEDDVKFLRKAPVEGAVTSGYYISDNGGITSTDQLFQVCAYPVTPGDTLEVYNYLHSGVARSYAIYSSSSFSAETALVVGPAVATSQDKQSVTVPEGGAYIVVQIYDGSYQCVNIVTEEALSDTVPKLEAKRYAVLFNGQDLFVAYNDGTGVEFTYWFKRCMANNLFTFYRVGYRSVTRDYPEAASIPTDENIEYFNRTGSDNIGPLDMSTGGYVGGNHTYNNGGVKTAKTESVRIFADGKELLDAASVYANDVCVRVENTLYDPAFAPSEGDTILSTKLCSEYVTYSIRKNTIEVSVSFQFVNGTTNTIEEYYGMQSMFVGESHIMTPNGYYADWTGAALSMSFNKVNYPNFNRFIEKNTTKSTYQATQLHKDFGLGSHYAIPNENNIFKRGSNKDYHFLIANMESIAGKYIEWSGGYTFIKNPVVDAGGVFAYRGIYKGQDALFINTTQAFEGAIEVPTDMSIRSAEVVECYGITNALGGSDFQAGGNGLYIKSISTGSLILLFN